MGSSGEMEGKRGARSSSTAGESTTQAERDLGQALRSAYSATLNEGTPQEFLDLLGKLS